MTKLIIAEKPSVAIRIALSLCEGKPTRKYIDGVSYYEGMRNGEFLYVVAAAGHLFTLHQKNRSSEIPVFDIEWVPAYMVNKAAYFTKKYLDVIKSVGSKCSSFINACDYDIEGTVIGSNIIKYIINNDANSRIAGEHVSRMKFSTTTTADLAAAYENPSNFDFNNMHAGEARHMLDWMWGINLSRALMNAVSNSGQRKILSIGRVQGPTLAILAKREKEIKDFKPEPFWKLEITLRGIQFENARGQIFDKSEAEKALDAAKAGKAIIEKVEEKEEPKGPFPPFDLTSLQLEASRVFGMDPSKTLAIAQTLYERSYISYPRTSSQKLPPTINHRRIIESLAKIERYTEKAASLISAGRFKPREGSKEDEAHPAIFPTGEMPKKLTAEEEKVYDLIAKRFLACFAEWARIKSTKITAVAGGEVFFSSGNIVGFAGWIDFYAPYYKVDEKQIPKFSQGEAAEIERSVLKEGETEPPRRYTKASLIGLLEKKNLGTKATRAAIIDTLFKRNYIRNSKIEVTEFGMSVYETLSKYSEEILNEEMTAKLEKDMDNIAGGKITEEEVIKEGKEMITAIIKKFNAKNSEIGKGLQQGLAESEKSGALGACLKCGGNLVIKRSRNNKQFVGCSNWPNCSNSYPLPQYARIVPTGKICELCHTPKVKVFMKGKVFEMDLDPNCASKKDWGKPKPKGGEAGDNAAPGEKEEVKAAGVVNMQAEPGSATAAKTRKKNKATMTKRKNTKQRSRKQKTGEEKR